MMREAMDTCCMSMPSRCIIPKVMAMVRGMDRERRTAERHSQKPMKAMRTTRTMAS